MSSYDTKSLPFKKPHTRIASDTSVGFHDVFVQSVSNILEMSMKHNCEMTEFPSCGLFVAAKKPPVFSSSIESLQEAWRWLLNILADLFLLAITALIVIIAKQR